MECVPGRSRIAKRSQSEAQGIIVERIENQFLAPTAYSALR
ncbi:hypothetical protein [Pseudomonas agarici]|nr:hypothetical protein [Pseudomonas agarici]